MNKFHLNKNTITIIVIKNIFNIYWIFVKQYGTIKLFNTLVVLNIHLHPTNKK